MANNLGIYNPLFYAQEALIQLENGLGMGARIHRGFEEERNSFRRGETINIRRPSTFQVQDAPSAAQELDPDTVPITLDKWKEVKFELTDKELALSEERIIEDHIRPAAYAIANYVDEQLCALALDVPWYYNLNSTPEVADITGMWAGMFNNKVPMQDEALNRIHAMWSGTRAGAFMALPAFGQYQGAGDAGVQTQMRGTLGKKFGFENFANQNTVSFTSGSASTGSLFVNGAAAAGASSINLDAGSVTGTLVKGDILTIAGLVQQFVVTETVTASTNAFASVGIYPALPAAVADNTAVVVFQQGAASTQKTLNMGFHRNAFALALAPLPAELIREIAGAKVETATSPDGTLNIRSRMFYDGNNSKVIVALDVLFGFTTLDGNLAIRGVE